MSSDVLIVDLKDVLKGSFSDQGTCVVVFVLSFQDSI